MKDIEKILISIIEKILDEDISLLDKIKLLEQGIKQIKKAENYAIMMNRVLEHDLHLSEKMKMDNFLELTDLEKKEVNAYWSKFSFAYKNDLKIQTCFSKASGVFSPKYMSEGLQWWYMFRFCEDLQYRDSFHDKNYFDLITPGVSHPPTILRKIRGMFYDGNRKRITLREAVNLCDEHIKKAEAEKIILKPSAGGEGRGIIFIRQSNTIEEISKILSISSDFIVEEIVFAHSSYSKFHPQSLNTLRIVSLLYNDEVSIVSSLFRMGRNSSELDNYSQGGITCGINLEGRLNEFGFDMFCNKYYKHPNSNIRFKNEKLESYKNVVKEVKRLHPLIPMLKHISWDFAVDRNGNPLLIEFNTRGDITMIQQNGDLPYGKYTDEILEDWLYYKFKIWKSNWEYDYIEGRETITIEKYNGYRSQVKIPNYIERKPVSVLKAGAFDKLNKLDKKSSIKVFLPKYINIIEENAFPNLENISIVYPKEYLEAPKDFVAFLNKQKKSVLLSWSAVKDSTGYNLFRICDTKETLIAKVNGACEKYEDKDIFLGKSTCKYSVQAVNEKDGRKSGKTYSLRVRLHEINGIKLIAIGSVYKNTAVRLVWEKDPYSKVYIVCRESEGESKVLKTTTNTSFIDRTMELETPYVYYVYPNVFDDLRGAKSRVIIVNK